MRAPVRAAWRPVPLAIVLAAITRGFLIAPRLMGSRSARSSLSSRGARAGPGRSALAPQVATPPGRPASTRLVCTCQVE